MLPPLLVGLRKHRFQSLLQSDLTILPHSNGARPQDCKTRSTVDKVTQFLFFILQLFISKKCVSFLQTVEVHKEPSCVYNSFGNVFKPDNTSLKFFNFEDEPSRVLFCFPPVPRNLPMKIFSHFRTQLCNSFTIFHIDC